MKNNIKKIITMFAFAILFMGNSALASVTWNVGDCPGSAIGNFTTGAGIPPVGSNDCWNLSNVSGSPNDSINVQLYYHNTGNTTSTNTKLFVTVSPALGQAATTHTFTSSITSDQGTTSFGTTTLTLQSPQALAFGSTYWYPNQTSNPISTGQSILTSSGLSIGSIAPGWSSQGSVVISFQVGNNTQSNCTINSFTANGSSSTTITQGSSATLAWNTSGCNSVYIYPNLGSVNSTGSQSVSPAQSTVYTLTATGSGWGQQTQSVTVNVTQAQNCTIQSFTANGSNSTTIQQGGSATLAWSTNGCNSVYIYPNLGSVSSTGSQSVSPAQSTVYTLMAYGQNGGVQTQTVTVNVQQQQSCVINSFTANGSSSTTITQGSSATLAWSTSNCTVVNISNIGNVNNSGSQSVSPTQTTTYTLTAYNSGYWTQQTQSVTVNVTQAQNCTIQSFTANGSNSTTIQQGGSATLAWSTNGCNSVNISNIGSVSNSGSQNVYPSYTTTYTLTAYGQSSGQQSQSVTVNVNNYYNNNCSISYFNASPTSINNGGSSVLSWNTNNCNSITISNLGYSVPFSGSQVVYPTYTTTYTLTAYGQNGGQQTQSVTVNVGGYNYNNCYISYFNASPTQINTGGSSTLTWSTSGCTSATISNLSYNISTQGSQVVYPSGTTTYTLTAYGQNYGNNWVQQTQTVTVYVNQIQQQNSCAITTIPTNVTKNSATLNGTFSGTGISNAYFEYGPTTGLGYQTQNRSANGSISFSDVISGLSSETVYYFRLVANCQNGISRGDLKVFQTLAPDVKPVIIQGTTVIGSGSPIMLKIENRSQVIRVGDTIYYTVTYKNIGSKTLTHPIVQVVLPDGVTFISSSRGTYSDNTRTLNVPIEDLSPGDDGTIYLQAHFDSYKSSENEIVTTALLVYTSSKGAQENAIAYVLNNPEGNNFGLGALALFSGFWGLGLIGWLLIIIIILLIILIYRRYFSKKTYINNYTNGYTDNHTNTGGHH